MKTDTVTLSFDSQFKGRMTSPTTTVALGSQPNGAMPYHLLYGALASCFYATFLSVANKKRLTFLRANLTVNGTKRDATPPTLSEVVIDFEIINPSDEAGLIQSAELGGEYCSIHETISKIATIKTNVTFKRE
jgi:putative redox protein